MGYAFISYSSRQLKELNRVKEYLKANDIGFWAAPDDIPIGSKYSEVIKRAISGASCVLLLLSDLSQNSTYCKLEIALALKLEKPIIPIQLEDVILNDDFSLFLSDSKEFFPIPKRFTTSKSVKLLNQLKILCTDPEEGPVEPVDPSYKIGPFRKGTWLQIFGWLWMIAGYIPFNALAGICFPVPPQFDSFTGDGMDPFNGPYIGKTSAQSAFLITALMLLGMLCVCYGFSLNRKHKSKERLYFNQFSLCQMMLLVSFILYGISYRVATWNLLEHLYIYCESIWIDACSYIYFVSLLMFLATFIVWLIRRIRQRRSRQKN